MIEIDEAPTTGQMEEAFQTVKSVTGKDEATVKRVLDEMGGDTTRAINRLVDLEAKAEVKSFGFFSKKLWKHSNCCLR